MCLSINCRIIAVWLKVCMSCLLCLVNSDKINIYGKSQRSYFCPSGTRSPSYDSLTITGTDVLGIISIWRSWYSGPLSWIQNDLVYPLVKWWMTCKLYKGLRLSLENERHKSSSASWWWWPPASSSATKVVSNCESKKESVKNKIMIFFALSLFVSLSLSHHSITIFDSRKNWLSE